MFRYPAVEAQFLHLLEEVAGRLRPTHNLSTFRSDLRGSIEGGRF